jgi:hypothetical protein
MSPYEGEILHLKNAGKQGIAQREPGLHNADSYGVGTPRHKESQDDLLGTTRVASPNGRKGSSRQSKQRRIRERVSGNAVHSGRHATGSHEKAPSAQWHAEHRRAPEFAKA